MKILWDDRGVEKIPDPLRVTVKKAMLAAFERCFEEDMGGLKYEVSVSFVSDAEIRELNSRYREKDCATDVLSFPAMEMAAGEVFPMGDIVISTETAARQAAEYGHDIERELAFLAVHGVLHLLGLDHEASEGDREIMEEIQETVLGELGF